MASTMQTPLRAVGSDALDRLGLDRVRERIREDIKEERCHGVNMIVARHGEVVLDITEGYADRAAGRALEPNAVFATMSVAKQFTNVLALSLVERGLLKLHAPVAELIPEFAKFGKEKVNLYHLLTHTSGVMAALPSVPPEVLMNIDCLVEFASGRPHHHNPRSPPFRRDAPSGRRARRPSRPLSGDDRFLYAQPHRRPRLGVLSGQSRGRLFYAGGGQPDRALQCHELTENLRWLRHGYDGLHGRSRARPDALLPLHGPDGRQLSLREDGCDGDAGVGGDDRIALMPYVIICEEADDGCLPL